MFGLTLHLGFCSNNYAEYMGVILGQLFFSLFKQTVGTIKTDSQLVVQQIKGHYKTKNVRLVELIKISHYLALKFDTIYMDWVGRDMNTIADQLSRYGSKPRLTSEASDVFRVYFDLSEFMLKQY